MYRIGQGKMGHRCNCLSEDSKEYQEYCSLKMKDLCSFKTSVTHCQWIWHNFREHLDLSVQETFLKVYLQLSLSLLTLFTQSYMPAKCHDFIELYQCFQYSYLKLVWNGALSQPSCSGTWTSQVSDTQLSVNRYF